MALSMVITGAHLVDKILIVAGKILPKLFILLYLISKKWWDNSAKNVSAFFIVIYMDIQGEKIYSCMEIILRNVHMPLVFSPTYFRSFVTFFLLNQVASQWVSSRSKQLDWQCLKSLVYPIFSHLKHRFVELIRVSLKINILPPTTYS